MKRILVLIGLAAALSLLPGCASSPKAESADVVSGGSKSGREMSAIVADIQPLADGARTLVAYYSKGSATKRVAEDLASLFGADIEVITEAKPRTMGLFGFMRSGYQASFGIASPIAAPVYDPSAYDRVVVLTPVWSWNLCPPVRTWLRLMKGKLPAAAFVTVSGDTKPDKIVAAMEKESGKAPLVFEGFGDRDFAPENRAAYVGKIRRIVEKLGQGKAL
jgi:hypothetical protein